VNARPSKPVNPFEGGYTQDNVLAPLGEGNAQQKLMADLSRLDSACIDMDGVLVHDSGMKHLLECLSGSVDADSKLRTPDRSEQSIVQFASESDWKKLLELRPSREEVSECAGSWRAGRGLREQEAWKALTLKLQKLGAKVWLLSSQPSLLIHAISSRLGLKDQDIRAPVLTFDANGRLSGRRIPGSLSSTADDQDKEPPISPMITSLREKLGFNRLLLIGATDADLRARLAPLGATMLVTVSRNVTQHVRSGADWNAGAVSRLSFALELALELQAAPRPHPAS